jgi:hypothetical protein
VNCHCGQILRRTSGHNNRLDRRPGAGGLNFFREVNGWKKLPVVIGILAGIVLTLLG